LALDQRRDLAVAAAEDQISFPMTRHRPILDRNGPVADRYGIGNLTVDRSLLRVGTRAAHAARASEVIQQLVDVPGIGVSPSSRQGA
jgi:hypothetical protein